MRGSVVALIALIACGRIRIEQHPSDAANDTAAIDASDPVDTREDAALDSGATVDADADPDDAPPDAPPPTCLDDAPRGPIVAYSFEAASATVVPDDGAAVALPLTINGDVAITGGAAVFGASGRLEASRADSSALQGMLESASAVTLEAWVESGMQLQDARIVSIGNGANHEVLAIGQLDRDAFGRLRTSGDGSGGRVLAGLAFADGTPHHVAITYDRASGLQRFFIDGEPAGSTTRAVDVDAGTAPSLWFTRDSQLGLGAAFGEVCCDDPAIAFPWVGSVDRFAVFDYALDPRAIACLVARGPSGTLE